MWPATRALPASGAATPEADGGLRALLRRAPRRHARVLAAWVLGALGVSGGVVWAAFTTSASPGSIALSSMSLSAYAPAGVSASRVGPTTCRVTWTASASPGAPAGLTYDVTDGVTTLATAVPGLTVDLTTSAQVTPVVRARLGNWTSSTSTTSGSFCTGVPGAPTAVALSAGDGQLAVTWTAPASDGGTAVTGYTATASPGAATCGSATASGCTITGLTNGTAYTVTVVATNAVGTGTASTAASGTPYPATVMSPARLRLWLDGADTSTLFQTDATTTAATAAGQAVMRWTDKSGQGTYVDQPTPANAPTLTTVNGRLAPGFNGSTTWLALNTTASLPSGTSTSTEIVVAAETEANPASSSYRVAWGHGTDSPGQMRQVWKDASSALSAADADNYTGYVTGRVWSGTPLVAVTEYSSAALRLWTAGSATTATANYAFNTGTGAARVGSKASGGQYWYGPVPEVIVFNTTLTTSERRQVEEYLARKWGSAITPRAPTAVTASNGDGSSAVTWTVPAWDGGSAITGYTATATDGTNTYTCTASGPSATGCSIFGLTDGLTYTITVTATNAAGTSAASTPATASPYPSTVMTPARMRLWLDGADSSTLFQDAGATTPATGSGQPVALWRDKSGQGNDAQQPTSSSRPLLTAANGRLVPGFDGSDDAMDMVDSTKLPTGTTSSTAFVAATPPAASGIRTALVWGGGTGSSRSTFLWDDALCADPYYTGPQACASGTVAAGRPLIMDSRFTATGIAVAADGGADAAAATSISSGTGLAEIGEPSTPWSGPMSEVVVFTGTLTTAERRQVTEYLARKWGSTITPQAPTGVTATPGDGTAAVTWTVPAWNGGSAVTGYTATATDGTNTYTCTAAGPTATSCTISGLTDGLTYTVTVTATNAVGTGPASSSASAIPYPASILTSGATKVWLDAQQAPTLRADTAGVSQATSGGSVQRWNTRTGSGWDAIKGSLAGSPTLQSTAINGKPGVRFVRTHPDYFEIANSGVGAVGSADRSIFAVAALRTTADNNTNNVGSVAIWPGWHTGLYGYGYPNVSAIGAADWSSGGSSPTANVTAGNSPLVADAIGSSGGGTLTSTASVNGGTSASVSASGSWNPYGDMLRIGAANYAGYGSWEWDLDGDIGEVIVLNRAATTAERRTVDEYLARKWAVVITPQAPSGVGASAGAGSAAVTWTVPAWDGGSSITGYTATAVPSDGSTPLTCTAGGATATGCTVTGMVSGLSYTVTVAATNAAGAGPSSGSASVTPTGTTIPSRPVGLNLTLGNAQITASWSAPASNGGSAVTGYTVTASPAGSCTAVAPATSCTITSLTAGTTYTVTVTATNGVGTGAASASASATALAAPGAPTAVTLTPGTGGSATTISTSWTAPSSNGGSALTGYTVTVTPSPSSACTPAGTATSCSFTGTGGTTYSVTVQAANAVGTGTASTAKSTYLFTNPGFEAGTLTGWTVSGTATATNTTANNGSWSAQLSPSAQISQTVTGLTPNTSYTFSIADRKSGGSPTGQIGVSGIAGATYTTLNPGNTFAAGSVTFTTGAAETTATLYLVSLNSTTFYDDAVLRAN